MNARIGLVHEWYASIGGSESVTNRIAEALCIPEISCLWSDQGVSAGAALRPSWLARTPLRGHKAVASALTPWVWRTQPQARSYDVVISSSHALGHTARLRRSWNAAYLSYVHTPARYLWSPELDPRGGGRLAAPARGALKVVDTAMSRHVDSIAVNSREVQRRVRQAWHRDSTVIHPPVDVEYFAKRAADPQLPFAAGQFLLSAGRFIDYKRHDFAIAVAEAAGLPIVIAGDGPAYPALVATAERSAAAVSFVRRPDRALLRGLFQSCLALVFAGHEDFGIVPVEVHAAGRPVVALARGGACETVVPDVNGVLVPDLSPRQFALAVESAAALDSAGIQRSSDRFSAARFDERVRAWVRPWIPDESAPES